MAIFTILLILCLHPSFTRAQERSPRPSSTGIVSEPTAKGLERLSLPTNGNPAPPSVPPTSQPPAPTASATPPANPLAMQPAPDAAASQALPATQAESGASVPAMPMMPMGQSSQAPIHQSGFGRTSFESEGSLGYSSKSCPAQKQFGEKAVSGPNGRALSAVTPESPMIDASAADEYLRARIVDCGLDQIAAQEFGECSGLNIWFEFMRGLAFIESGWNHNCHTPNDVRDTPSDGLFQMTGPGGSNPTGDVAAGAKCFRGSSGAGSPMDAAANIDCAVSKMMELMGGSPLCTLGQHTSGPVTPSARNVRRGHVRSLRQNAKAYWGAIPRQGANIRKILEHAKAHACQSSSPDAQIKPIDWPGVLNGRPSTDPSSSRSASPRSEQDRGSRADR